MNLNRVVDNLIRWVVICIGIGIALFSVRAAGNGEYGRVILIFLMMAIIAVVLILREQIWMVIPLIWALSGQIPALGVPFTVRDLTVMVIFVSFLVLKAFKIVTRQAETRWLDAMLYVMLAYLIVGFIRNPVGVAAVESERVGGRAYFNVCIACLAYWVLSRSAMKPAVGKRLAAATAATRAIEGVMAQLLSWIPALAAFFTMYYISPFLTLAENADQVIPGAESTKRFGYLLGIGQPILFYLFAVDRPLTALNPLRYWRFLFFLIGITCLLLSGFRSAIALCLGVALVSSYVYRGWGEVIRMVGLMMAVLFVLVVGNGVLFELPRSAHRALSFLPGKWDEYAKMEAAESTKWRVDMWMEMLTTNRYIDNHLVGDGFGFKRRDMELIAARQQRGIQANQDDFMAMGGVHSGPVSAVRYVGYVGLGIYLIILGGMAVEAWKLIRKARGSPFQVYTYFFCLPAVIEPFYFVFVFGAFEASLPETILLVGMMRMVRNSLADYAAARSDEEGAETLPVPDLPEEVAVAGDRTLSS